MVLKNQYTPRNINIHKLNIYKKDLLYKKRVFLFNKVLKGVDI